MQKNKTLNEKQKYNFFFIINPNAGKEEAKQKWPLIERILTQKKIKYSSAFTTKQGDAENYTIEKIYEGFRYFIVVGGDGTLNEVVNGIFRQNSVSYSEIFIGLIQMGTGNDWARYYGFNNNIENSVKRLENINVKQQDVGKIIFNDSGEQKEAYFINVAGLCFDAVVVKATNAMKERGQRTKSAYLIALLSSLIKYKPWELKIKINGTELNGKFLSISIGNGKYSGGGMMQTPNAIIDDGLLDVTIYDDMPKSKIIRNVKKLYDGTVINVSGVKTFRCKTLQIENLNNQSVIFAETDGEIIGNGPYTISVLHNVLNILS
ncbi:MAG TPA: diacylglycerol kinase family lipid kinase [Bacteroidales bacterium]|nr:diacylglycerol kinase family lipid kinase [Bacteroidales bacterium]